MDNDKSSPIMISGATGYVAGWVVREFLEAGHTVHAPVRDPDNVEKIAALQALAYDTGGKIKFFKADLMQDGSYDEAMAGCEVVLHTASPFALKVEDKQRDLVDPAVHGTRNVMRTVNRTPSVKRVVDTSSCAAVYGDSIDLRNTANGLGVLTEADWNTTSTLDHQTYYYSKTLAEKEAWRINNLQSQWDLVVLNPSFVVGPAIDTAVSSESFAQIAQFGDGTLKQGAPEIGTGIIDVRDLAVAHYRAAFTPTAAGRYIISGHNSDFLEVAKILHAEFGDRYPIPNKKVPKWLLWLVGPLVSDGLMTRKVVSRNIGIPWRADNSKSIRDLDMSYRPLKESLVDMFNQMIDAGRF